MSHRNGAVIKDDPQMGYKIKYYCDEEGNVTLKTVYYPWVWEQFLDNNKAMRNMGREGYVSKGDGKETDMWRAASLPAAAVNHFKIEHGVDIYNPHHEDGVKKLLNDSDYANLRTGEFKV